MGNRLAFLMAAFAAASLFCAPACEQGHAQAPPTAANAPAVLAAGDNFGVWNAMRGNYDFSSFSKGDPQMTPWGKVQFDAAKPSQGKRGVPLQETTDRVYKCVPPGMPYIYLQLFPMQIVQTPKEVIELFESDHTVRHIYTDGRKHPATGKPSYNGHSIGHWENGTLVVDTIGMKGRLWLDRLGHPESEQMHIVERIQRVDEKTLQVDFTFDDPKSYPKPWTAQIRFLRHPDWDIMEDVCEDNLAFESFEK